MRRALLAAAALLLAGILAPRSVRAQGEHAGAQPAGSFRLSVGAEWAHFTERFGMPRPAVPTIQGAATVDGARELLGLDFGDDSLGVQTLPFLVPTQNQLRQLTGIADYSMNLGRSVLTLDANVRQQPIRLRWAPSRRFGLGVNVPIVRARMSVFLSGPDSTVASQGNVGLSSTGSYATFTTESEAALLALAQAAASGPVGFRPQAQAQLDALRPLLCGLSSLVGAAAATSPCFSTLAAPPALLLPVVGSASGDSITARLARAQADYETVRTQAAGQGVTLPPLGAVFDLPAVALDSTELRRFFSDPAGSLAGDSLLEVVRTGIGDMEVGAWLQLADGPRWRSQLEVTLRLPTGKMDDPDNFLDLGTGDHQTDVEVALRNDLVINEHLWLHLGGRYGLQMADQLVRRVTPWYLPFAPVTSRADVERNLGDYLQVDLVPNWQLDDALNVGIGWHYFRQGATTFAYADPADEARIGLPASVLGLATSVTRMRVGAGVTFSTLSRYARRQARLPYRVTWSYNATFSGRGGQVPKAGVMTVEIQAFFRNLR